MSPEVAARLQEFGQFLDDVDEAWEFVANALIAGPDEGGAATQNLIDALNSAT